MFLGTYDDIFIWVASTELNGTVTAWSGEEIMLIECWNLSKYWRNLWKVTCLIILCFVDDTVLLTELCHFKVYSRVLVISDIEKACYELG